jgi:hypothetical protein
VELLVTSPLSVTLQPFDLQLLQYLTLWVTGDSQDLHLCFLGRRRLLYALLHDFEQKIGLTVEDWQFLQCVSVISHLHSATAPKHY